MIIGACGYIGTGSSLVTDLLKEYEEIQPLDFFEFMISYYPDGLEDLEYQINTHRIKHMSSVVAIERFKKAYYNALYDSSFDKNVWEKISKATNCFIDDIAQITYQGGSALDYQLFGKGKQFRSKNLNRPMWTIGGKLKKRGLLYKNTEHTWGLHEYKFAMDDLDFSSKANAYINEIIKAFGMDVEGKVLLDQPFSATNPLASMKYFGDDAKAIIIDRDPRDVYIAFKAARLLYNNGYQIPADDVDKFISFYRKLREKVYWKDNSNILMLNMESFIYEYDKTVSIVEEFCGLERNVRKYEFFNPQKSIANTQLIKKYPQYKNDIKIISDELKEFLFPFEDYGEVDTSGRIFFNRSTGKY